MTVAALIFTALWLATLVFLHLAPTGYSPLRNAVSEYGVGRFAWGYRAQVTFAALAAISLAVELHGLLRVLLLVFAGARIAIAFFPTDPITTTEWSTTGRVHVLLAAIAFASICWAACSDEYEPWLGYVATAGALGTFLGLRRVPQLRPVVGLLERFFYAAIIAWFFVVAVKSS